MVGRGRLYDSFCQELVAVFEGDTVVESLAADESWYNQYKLFNSYFHKGYIRSDAATLTDESADMAAGRYAILVQTCKPGGDVEFSQKYGEEYIMIPLQEPFRKYNAGATTINGISVTSKNPEAALKLLGVMWTDEEVFNTLHAYYGTLYCCTGAF